MNFLGRDGVALSYQQVEGDGTPILLLHGWCCDHSYLAPQFDYFAAKGHRVIAPDLRGHGHSDKPRQSYPIEVFTEDIAWLCRQLGLQRAIVIGHSMGGMIAFDLAVRYQMLSRAFVMIDSAMILPPEVRRGFAYLLQKLQSPDYPRVLREMAKDSLSLPGDDIGVRKAVMLDRMLLEPQDIMVTVFAGLSEFDATKARDHTLPPSLYIAAGDSNPRCDTAQLQALAPNVQFDRIPDAGHFCQLERPERVNSLIELFLATCR